LFKALMWKKIGSWPGFAVEHEQAPEKMHGVWQVHETVIETLKKRLTSSRIAVRFM